MAAISRSDLQALAVSRLADARLLLRRHRDSSAYYLAGYAVEFALKAVIALRIERHVLPEPSFFREVYTTTLKGSSAWLSCGRNWTPPGGPTPGSTGIGPSSASGALKVGTS